MDDFKKIAKQYRVPVSVIDDTYEEAVKVAENLEHRPSEELVMKIFYDLLDSLGMKESVDYSDLKKKRYYENLADKILDSEEDDVEDILGEEMQTSGQISGVLGMAKKKPEYIAVDLLGQTKQVNQ